MGTSSAFALGMKGAGHLVFGLHISLFVHYILSLVVDAVTKCGMIVHIRVSHTSEISHALFGDSGARPKFRTSQFLPWIYGLCNRLGHLHFTNTPCYNKWIRYFGDMCGTNKIQAWQTDGQIDRQNNSCVVLGCHQKNRSYWTSTGTKWGMTFVMCKVMKFNCSIYLPTLDDVNFT